MVYSDNNKQDSAYVTIPPAPASTYPGLRLPDRQPRPTRLFLHTTQYSGLIRPYNNRYKIYTTRTRATYQAKYHTSEAGHLWIVPPAALKKVHHHSQNTPTSNTHRPTAPEGRINAITVT